MRRRHIRLYWFILGMALSFGASAQDYLKYEASLEGTAFHVDSSSLVTDTLIYTYGGSLIDSDYLVKDVISLAINDNESVVFPDSFSCTVKIAIEEYDVYNNEITTYKILHVSYNDRNLALDTLRSYYEFYKKYKVKDSIISITMNGISGSPDIFTLTNSIEIQRQYITSWCGFNWFNGQVDTQYIADQDELYIGWTVYSTIPGFAYDEFDLEWTFYDDSSVLIKNYLYPSHASPYSDAAFLNNATRVQTANNWYQIPLLYEQGYVMFRMRTVQILPSGQRLPGPWTSTTASGNNAYIYHISGHQDSLNWQAKTSYAEEGKRKSVVSYFDGASKNRQSVTKINTDTMSIAAETIYDYEGRPVVNTLPSPTFQKLIRHFDNFNQDAFGNSYSWMDADSSNDCSNIPGIMNSVSGSSRYYSTANPLKTIGYNQYIPNAWGYPFSQQVYTADLTGRIKFSSGPGLYHHMGTQHITQYLYGAPAQQELTQLFGTEVGDASHYFKNATIDPNGQTTVTYTDMHGRTIATALSGTPLYASLDTLSEFRMDTILDVILDTNSNFVQGDSIVCTKTFMSLVSPIDTYYFKYCLLPPSDTIQLCNGSDFCFDCIYDITIKITDDCNNHKLPGDTPILRILHDYSPAQSLNNFDTLCSNLPPLVVDSFYIGLPPGTYTVTKTLTVNSNAINYYYNYFLTRDTCIKSFNYFYTNALNQVDLSGCNMNCQQCEQQLGDSITFITKYLAAIIAQDSLTQLQAQDTLNAASAFSELKSYCNMLCDSFTICDEKRLMMINDMSPGGQYATDTPSYQATDPASIFYSGHTSSSAFVTISGSPLLSPLPIYSNPAIVYLNAQGVPDTLVVDTSGFAADSSGQGNLVSVTPNQLSIQNFEKYWNPSWANALLPYHPEYCSYEFCVGNSASNDYDSWESSISDYDTAVYYGLMNPLNDATSAFPTTPLKPDPFFATGGYGASYAASVKHKMDQYVSWGSPDTTLSIWQIIMEMANNGSLSSTCPNCMKNYYWINFRSIYQGIKQQYVDDAMAIYAGGGTCDKANFNAAPLLGKTPRWGPVADSLWANSNISNPATLLDSTQEVYSADSTASFTCTTYAPYWWGQLSQCGIPQADSALIINELISVCALGTDSVHMFGSTTTPGSGITTTNGNWTFEQVLQWATAVTATGTGGLIPWTYHPSDSCTSLLITNPMPYSTSILYYETDAISPPDTCTCRKIMTYYSAYAATDSSAMSFGAYLDYYYNMTIDSEDASILVSACNNPTCLLLPHPVEVPYLFNCEEQCVTCAQVQAAYTLFLDSFPGVVSSVNYLTLMQSFMNSQLRFNITAQEYLEFLNDSCGQNVYTVDTTSPPSQSCPMPSNSNSSISVIAGCTSTVSVVSGACTGQCNVGIISVNTGSVSASGGQITYTAQGAAGSADTVTYRVCNQCGLCDTARLFVSITTGTCPIVSSAVNHNYYICNGDAQTFLPIQGNTPPAGSQFTLMGFIPASPTGVTQSYNDFTFQAPDTSVADTFRYILCATGTSTVCDTAYVFIKVNNCNWDSTGGGSAYAPMMAVVRRGTSTKPGFSASNILTRKNSFGQRAVAGLDLKPFHPGIGMGSSSHNGSYVPQGVDYSTILKRRFALARNAAAKQQVKKLPWKVHPLYGGAFASVQAPQIGDPKTFAKNLLTETFTKWKSAHPQKALDSLMNVLKTRMSLRQRVQAGSNNESKGLAYSLAHRKSPQSTAMSIFLHPLPEPASAIAKKSEVLKRIAEIEERMQSAKSRSENTHPEFGTNNLQGVGVMLNGVRLQKPVSGSAMGSLNTKLQSLYSLSRLRQQSNFESSSVLSLAIDTVNLSSYSHGRRNFDRSDTTWCDSLSYLINEYDTLYVQTGNSNWGNLKIFLYDSLGIGGTLTFWQQQFASCGITCPPIVDCTFVSSLMANFYSSYPEYSSSCAPFLWANYLNNYNGGSYGGASYAFNPDQWIAIFNCCGISYPSPDTLYTMCDSINEILPLVTPGQPLTMYNLSNTLDNIIGYNYDPATGLFGDITYWINQFNSCGIPCSTVIPCNLYDSVMTQFKNNDPTFADSCPAFIWINSITNASLMEYGVGAAYSVSDWEIMLNCCGVSYPRLDTLQSQCDSVNAFVSEFNSSYYSEDLSDFEFFLNSVFGYGYSEAAWFSLLDSCRAPCPNVANITYTDSLLGEYFAESPVDSGLNFMWADLLGITGAANGDEYYSPQQWKYILNACDVYVPNARSASFCDSLEGFVNLFNLFIQQNPSDNNVIFFDHLASSLLPRINDSTGHPILYSYDHWVAMMDSCHIPCPNFVNCSTVDSLMRVFLKFNSFIDSSCPPFIWANYLNEANITNGFWYSDQDWMGLLSCCGVHYPKPDTLKTRCDSVTYTVKFSFNTQPMQIIAIFNAFNELFGPANDLSEWFMLLRNCGINCKNFSNCYLLDSLMTSFETEYPQYADSCPPFVITEFLNLELFSNSGLSGTYDDFTQLYACCGSTLPTQDTLIAYCDTAAYANTLLQYSDQELTQFGDSSCRPAWLWTLFLSSDTIVDSTYNSFTAVSDLLQSCGYTPPDTCTLYTNCDTLNSFYPFITALWLVNPSISEYFTFETFTAFYYNYIFGTSYSYPQLQLMMFECGELGICDSVSSQLLPITTPLFATYDSTCMEQSALAALLNTLTQAGYTGAQWMQIFGVCGDSLPPICMDSLTTTCQKVLVATILTNRMDSIYGMTDTFVLPQVMSSILGYTVSFATADSLIGACIMPGCSVASQTYAQLGTTLHFDTCYPSWYLITLWDMVAGTYDDSYDTAQVSSYGQLCSTLSACSLPCPDTCGGLGPNRCDTIEAIYTMYEQMSQTSGIDTLAIVDWLMTNMLYHHPVEYAAAYDSLISLYNACTNPPSSCDSFAAAWAIVLSNPFAIDGNPDSTLIRRFNIYMGCYPQYCYSLDQIYGLIVQCVTTNPLICSRDFTELFAEHVNVAIDTFLARNPTLIYSTQAALDTAMYHYLDSVFDISSGYYGPYDSVYSTTGFNWCNLSSKCSLNIHCPTASPGGIHYLCNRPLLPPIQAFTDDSCMATMQQYALQNASQEYQDYIQALYDSFVNQYITKCLGAWRMEHMYDRHRDGEYHYTLYYYDQAGNLVQTVPPDGAIPDSFPHTYLTKYRYNTQNQVVEQLTPDADSTFFWYDRIFKLTFSQNGKQRALNQFSYTNYDPIQRIIEVGRFDGYDLSSYYFWDLIAFSDSNWYTSLTHGGVYPHEVTHTYYDYDYLGVAPRFQSIGMTNLRNRVASVIYADTLTPDSSRYDAATHYSYDVDGNVQTLLQENRRLKKINEDFKRIDYRYDLISGKVNNVSYQSGQPDAFYHYYEYDADNRITDVYTSRDSTFFDHDAFYQYYLHGPLARAVIGDRQVQAINYAYTIQGWLKSINGDRMNSVSVRMGQDGLASSPNALVGYDAYGFSLGYFTGDYSSINGANPVAIDYGLGSWDLYNGNISRTKGFNLGLRAMSPAAIASDTGMAYRYRYDQLNRLTGMNAASYIANGSDTSIPFMAMPDYGEHVSYDPNGNIATYTRNGTTMVGSPLAMDSLTYKYQNGNNKLDHVNDAVPATNYSVDIDNEDTLNYRYDQIGNLTKDSSGGIDSIYWTVYGKIWRIVKHNGDTIRFHYDPSGNRIAKEVFKDSLHKWTGTYYAHDATGNIMSTYHWYNKDTFQQDELMMYGSSRLGTINLNQYLTDTITRDSAWLVAHPVYTNPLCDSITYDATGLKQYEFTNHLGNVLVTLTDKHIPIYTTGPSFLYYIPEVASAQDYYPFGMIMPGRNHNDSLFRFGFNNKEKDDETYGQGNEYDYGFRIYNPRLGKFLSVDPLFKKYPELTSYQFASNTPLIGIDVDGLELLDFHSAVYRELYLGSVPNIKTQTSDALYMVVQEQSNTPPDYVPDNGPNAPKVGPHGKDVTPNGPVVQSGSSNNSANSSDDDGNSAKKPDYIRSKNNAPLPMSNKNPNPIFDDVNPPANGFDFALLTKDMSKNTWDIVDLLKSDWGKMDRRMEAHAFVDYHKDQFYKAFDIVNTSTLDVSIASTFKSLPSELNLSSGRAFGDLINFVNDGTLPDISQNKDVGIYNQIYRQIIYSTGVKILQKKGVDIQDKTKLQDANITKVKN